MVRPAGSAVGPVERSRSRAAISESILFFTLSRNGLHKCAMHASTPPATLLRERGVQITAQRLAVLRVVSALPHATADEIAEAVRTEIGAVSRQAVYDALRRTSSPRPHVA